MPTKNSRMIAVTDDTGRLVMPPDDAFEPNRGSIVLVRGLFGTAWQRFFSDGLWYPTRATANQKGGKTWDQMLAEREVFLVYDADERGQS